MPASRVSRSSSSRWEAVVSTGRTLTQVVVSTVAHIVADGPQLEEQG